MADKINIDPSAPQLPPEAITFATKIYDAARAGQMDIFEQALPAGLPANMTNEKGDSLVSLIESLRSVLNFAVSSGDSFAPTCTAALLLHLSLFLFHFRRDCQADFCRLCSPHTTVMHLSLSFYSNMEQIQILSMTVANLPLLVLFSKGKRRSSRLARVIAFKI